MVARVSQPGRSTFPLEVDDYKLEVEIYRLYSNPQNSYPMCVKTLKSLISADSTGPKSGARLGSRKSKKLKLQTCSGATDAAMHGGWLLSREPGKRPNEGARRPAW